MKIIFISCIFLSTLFSKTIMCYKNDITQNTVQHDMLLDGQECNGKLSSKQMQENGWKVDNTTVIKNKDNYNHIYLFRKDIVQNKAQNIQTTTIELEKEKIQIKKPNLKTQSLKIFAVTEEFAKISLGNLQAGQSGVIINQADQNKIIISQAYVESSNNTSSTLKIIQKDILPQDAIPTSKLKPSNGDTFILNHLYSSSLLIVANKETKDTVLEIYKEQNFLNEDFFAAYLKLEEEPTPEQKNFQDFSNKNQIGTIFFAIENRLFIVDALSFKVIASHAIDANSIKIKVPFLSKIETIERGFWDFGDDEIENYNEYYLKLLGITK